MTGNSNKSKNKGFTLIEMLVSVFIFSIIIGVGTGVFTSAIKLQKYNLIHQQLLDQSSYVIEYMARAIRMAQKDDDGVCILPDKNYRVSNDNTKIEFKNSAGDCQQFFLDKISSRLMENKTDYSGPIYITSDDFKVNSFNITVFGDGSSSDNIQPRITIFLELEGKAPGSQPIIKIQTTVSQRNLDI